MADNKNSCGCGCTSAKQPNGKISKETKNAEAKKEAE